MPQFSNFVNNAAVEYTVSAMNNTDSTTVIAIAPSPSDPAHLPTTWPQVPFYAEIDRGTDNAEIVNVTIRSGVGSGTTYTVTRGSALGSDALGSTTKSHAPGSSIVPVFSAADARDAVLTNFIDQGSMRNAILNGAFNIWSRGETGFSTSGMTADRWLLTVGTGATCAVQSAAGLTEGSRKSIQWARSVAGSTESSLVTRIEDAHSFAGETVTLSFVAKTAGANITLNVGYTQMFGTGGSPSATVNSARSDVLITSTATKISQTFTIPSVLAKTFGTNNDDYLAIGIYWPQTQGNGTITITDVQLAPGSQTGSYPRIHPQQELILCQRYFQRIGGYAANQILAGGGQAVSDTRALFNLVFPTPMRTVPSLTVSSAVEDMRITDWDSANEVTSITLDTGTTPRSARLLVNVAGGLTLATPYSLYTETATPYIDFSAEL